MRQTNLTEVIQATDALGVCRFKSTFWEMSPERYTHFKGAPLQLELASDIVCLLKHFVHHPKHMNATLIKRMAPSYTLDKPNKIIEMTYNACPVLCLPGDNPAAEIAEFSAFLDAVKARILQMHQGAPDHIGSMGFMIATKSDQMIEALAKGLSPEQSIQAQQFADELSSMVAASPLLTAWRGLYGRMLLKMGPWSWSTMTERDFFEMPDCPLYAKEAKRQMAEPKRGPKP